MMRRGRHLARRWAGAIALGLCSVSSVARATYSIVAADGASEQVGAAGTSCVGPLLTIITIYGSAPGKGAVVAQARVNEAGRDEAVRLLELGTAPSDIIQAITSASFDPATFFGGASQRQYGVVDILGRSAGFTGADTMAYADDIQGSLASIVYSVQGNILTGPAVLDQARTAFEEPACDLAERLMKALEAGADGGQGDSRCTPDGIPSDGAFIQVDLPDATAGSFLRLEANDTAPQSPLPLLRAQFDQWRSTHPCPTGTTDAGMSVGAGGNDASDTTTGGAPNDPIPADASLGGSGGSAGVGQATGGVATTAPSNGGTVSALAGETGGALGVDGGSTGERAAGSQSDSGCGCRFAAVRTNAWGLLLILAIVACARVRFEISR